MCQLLHYEVGTFDQFWGSIKTLRRGHDLIIEFCGTVYIKGKKQSFGI